EAEGGRESGRDRELLEWSLSRLGPVYGHLERTALWRRHARELGRLDFLEEIGERHVRELRLGLGRPCLQDAHASRAGERKAHLPDARLADSGLARHEERARPRSLGEELLDRRELALSPDQSAFRESGSGQTLPPARLIARPGARDNRAEPRAARLAVDREHGAEGHVARGTAVQRGAAAGRAAIRQLVLEVLEPALRGAAVETDGRPVAEHLPALLAQPVRRLAHQRFWSASSAIASARANRRSRRRSPSPNRSST